MRIAAAISRTLLVAIIIAGVIDPAWTASRSVTPAVAIVHDGNVVSTSLADRVAAALDREFTIAREVSPDAGAVVTTGRDLPAFAETMTMPAFAVTPAGADVRIVRVDAPARGHVHARIPVDVRLRAWHARGRSLAITIAANGVTVDSASRQISSDDETIDVPVSMTPAATGVVPARVTASIAGEGSRDAHADTLVRVDDRPWTVLVFDRRPSWMSTFVRRAIEADPRFTVVSRTATSTGVSTDTPGAPATLNDTNALAKFDAIVIGAPDALSPIDVASLDIFLRRRGGSVALLWDVPPTGPAAAMGGVTRWTNEALASDQPIDTPYGALRASEVARSTAGAAAVWSAPIGSGRVFVSGALDSWRYRTAPNSLFDRVWTSLVAEAADRAPAPLAVSLTPRVVRPGGRVDVTIRSRDASGEYVDSAIPPVRVSARLSGDDGRAVPIRVWPGDTPGVYRASIVAPELAGDVHVIASVAPDRPGASPIEGDADLQVAADAVPAAGDSALAAWTSSRGGAVFDEAHIPDLVAALHRALASTSATQTTHPMRSPWWIAPVTLVASLEWWIRRRRGLR